MLTLIVTILLIVGLFKITGFVLHIAGKVLGGILGIIGWLILGGIAVSLLGLAIYALPVILIIGIIALIVAAAR